MINYHIYLRTCKLSSHLSCYFIFYNPLYMQISLKNETQMENLSLFFLSIALVQQHGEVVR